MRLIQYFNLDKISYAGDLVVLKCSNNKNHFFKVNLSNYKETEKAVLQADPDLIVHLAAESHVDRSMRMQVLLFK